VQSQQAACEQLPKLELRQCTRTALALAAAEHSTVNYIYTELPVCRLSIRLANECVSYSTLFSTFSFAGVPSTAAAAAVALLGVPLSGELESRSTAGSTGAASSAAAAASASSAITVSAALAGTAAAAEAAADVAPGAAPASMRSTVCCAICNTSTLSSVAYRIPMMACVDVPRHRQRGRAERGCSFLASSTHTLRYPSFDCHQLWRFGSIAASPVEQTRCVHATKLGHRGWGGAREERGWWQGVCVGVCV